MPSPPAPLTYVGAGHSAYNAVASQVTTAGVTVQTGDLLYAVGTTALKSVTTMDSVVASGVTWNPEAFSTTSAYPHINGWSGVATTSGSLTATFTASNGSSVIGGSLYAMRYSDGLQGYTNNNPAAATNDAAVPSGTASVEGHSFFLLFAAAQPGAGGGSRTFNTTFGTATETLFSSAAALNVVHAYWPDVPASTSGNATVTGMVSGAPGTQSQVVGFLGGNGAPAASPYHLAQQQGVG